MKKLLFVIIISCSSICSSYAQNIGTGTARNGSWKYAFSEDGRQNWKPEFTVRYYAGFVTEGPVATAGIKVDDKRTLGIWIGQGDTYVDAAPGNIYAIQTAAYMRRYVHLGRRDIVALYGEIAIGCDWIYKVNGKYRVYDNPQTGEYCEEEHISESKGDVGFYAGVNAGIRFRVAGNFHLFLGPTIMTGIVGFHLGIGF